MEEKSWREKYSESIADYYAAQDELEARERSRKQIKAAIDALFAAGLPRLEAIELNRRFLWNAVLAAEDARSNLKERKKSYKKLKSKFLGISGA